MRLNEPGESVVVVPSVAPDRRRSPAPSVQAYEERFLFLLLLLRQPRLRMIYVTGPADRREHRRVLPRAAAGRHPEPCPRAPAPGRRARRLAAAAGDEAARAPADPRRGSARSSPTARAATSCRTPRRRSSATSRWRSASRCTAPTRGCSRSAPRPAAGGCSPRPASPHPLGLRGPARPRRRGRRAGAPARRAARRDATRSSSSTRASRAAATRSSTCAACRRRDRRRGARGAARPRRGDGARAPRRSSPRAYLARLAEGGGIVEERIDGAELRSPSVQLRVTPLGEVELLSTHDQLLGGPSGQSYLGCRFPADFGLRARDHREAAEGRRAARARGRARPLRRRLRRRARRARRAGSRTRSSSTCARAARRIRS